MIPRKRFGQHFLIDAAILEQITQAIAPKKNDHLVEIGPGLGALSKKILRAYQRFDLIELDANFIPELKRICRTQKACFIHQADALRFDFSSIFQDRAMRIVGNLPYNIATPLLFHLCDFRHLLQDMHFLLQLEVANRLCAKPRTKAYGRLSVMMQYHWQMEISLLVTKEAFYPKPKVASALVRFTPQKKRAEPAKDLNFFSALVRQAFNQRRKTLRNSLKEWIAPSSLQALEINANARAEELSLEDFIRISNCLDAKSLVMHSEKV